VLARFDEHSRHYDLVITAPGAELSEAAGSAGE